MQQIEPFLEKEKNIANSYATSLDQWTAEMSLHSIRRLSSEGTIIQTFGNTMYAIPEENLPEDEEQLRAMFYRCEKEMKRLAGCRERFVDVLQEANDLEIQLAACRKRHGAAADAQLSAHREADEARKSYLPKLLRFLFVHRRQAKYAKIQLIKAVQESEESQADIVRYENKLLQMMKDLGDLETKIRRRRAVDGARKKTLDKLFDGYMKGDEAENEIERKRDAALSRKERIVFAMIDQTGALSRLEEADVHMQNICRFFEDTSQAKLGVENTSGWGKHREDMGDGEVRYNLERAYALGKRVNSNLKEAKMLSKGLPLGENDLMRERSMDRCLKTGDKIYDDCREHIINRELRDAIKMHQLVRGAARWQEKHLELVRRDIAEAEKALSEAGDELVKERLRLMQN